MEVENPFAKLIRIHRMCRINTADDTYTDIRIGSWLPL